jgi:3-hydroxyacyl-[acyl-carrier-protein] dehydratase
MAQVGGVSLLYPDENRGKIAYFAGMEGVKFRKPVVPGDQVRMEAEVTRLRGSVGKVRAEAFVEGQLVAEAEFMFALSDKQE